MVIPILMRIQRTLGDDVIASSCSTMVMTQPDNSQAITCQGVWVDCCFYLLACYNWLPLRFKVRSGCPGILDDLGWKL